jgi:hypothetical protein
MRYLTCLCTLALCVIPASAQTDLSTRVAELERLTAQHTKELQALRATADDHEKRLSILEGKSSKTPANASGALVGLNPPCPAGLARCIPYCQGACHGSTGTCNCGPASAVRYWTYAGSGVVYGSDGSVSSADGFQTLAGGSCSTGSCSAGASYYSSYPASIFTSSGSGGCASGSCGSSGRVLGFFRRGR